MNMREARLLISRAYAVGDDELKREAHDAACHATVEDNAEAAAIILVAEAQLRGLAHIAGPAGERNADNIAAVLRTLFRFLDAEARPRPVH